MKAVQPSYSNPNPTGSNTLAATSNPYPYYPQHSLKTSQLQSQQQQLTQPITSVTQQPMQQQGSSGVVGYTRSQSRHSQHQSENQPINSSLIAKYSKQPTGSTTGLQQSSQVLRDSNYNNLNNSKLSQHQQQQQQQQPQQPLQQHQPTQSSIQHTQQRSQNALNSSKITSQASQSANVKVHGNNENKLANNSNSSFQTTQIPNQTQLIKQNSSQQSRLAAVTAPIAPVKKRKTFECGGTAFCVDDNYEFNKQIGAGAYGVVCSGVDLKTDKKIAIKKITNAFEDLVDAKRILREIKMLKFLSHENIISLYDIIVPEDRTGYEDIYIVTELMETDLHRVIYSRQELTDDHIQHFLYQTLCALQVMHSANIMHRDLKPANILVNKNCDLKVCDLGLARGFDDDESNVHTEYVVTRWYRAPEVILRAQKYTKAVDVWSVGCIFAELLGRTPLFPGKDYLEQIQRTIAILGTPSSDELRFIQSEGALKYVKGLPKRSKQNWESLFPNSNPVGLDLLSKMLTFNPDNRYTVQECLKHPYFENYQNPDEELPVSEPFDWSWDDFKLSKEKLQSMVYDEAVSYQKVKNSQ